MVHSFNDALLYQGTTSLVPQRSKVEMGFSPCASPDLSHPQIRQRQVKGHDFSGANSRQTSPGFTPLLFL
jgi:hypothetical protein